MSMSENLKKLFSLKGKVVLLTGAVGGIGSELARGMAGVGADMALADLTIAPIDQLIGELDGENHAAFALDIRNLDSIRQLVSDVLERYGRIDVLVNCAGINKREGFLDVEESTYDRIMDINLKGLYFLTQAVVRESMMKTGGKIINMASYNSTSMLGGVSVYGATKSAVAALTRSMAVEWAKFNIQANAIAPGHILTNLTKVTWGERAPRQLPARAYRRRAPWQSRRNRWHCHSARRRSLQLHHWRLDQRRRRRHCRRQALGIRHQVLKRPGPSGSDSRRGALWRPCKNSPGRTRSFFQRATGRSRIQLRPVVISKKS